MLEKFVKGFNEGMNTKLGDVKLGEILIGTASGVALIFCGDIIQSKYQKHKNKKANRAKR